jgi:hypothetical protein
MPSLDNPEESFNILLLFYTKNAKQKEILMLRTEAIANAFNAICEEAELIQKLDVSEQVKEKASTIISIARHQNDIRSSPTGSCPQKHSA